MMNRLCLAFAVFVIVAGVQAILIAQNPEKEQKPCPAKAQVFVLEPSEIPDKFKELNQQGFCVDRSHLLVVGDKLLLIMDDDDKYIEDEAGL